MKRSIEFPCDKRWVKNPTNNPIATIGQRMAASARTKKAIAAVQAILSAHFTPPPMSQAPRFGFASEADRALLLKPNRWTVRLTRISPGTLDPLTGGASMKTIQDAVARWCGVPDERNPIWTWVEPIGQEKRGQGVYGVRIEIESLEPGQDRIVRLKGVEAREPKVKRGRPTVGDLRTAAERAFNRAGVSKESRERIMSDAAKLQADPGEERAACMLRGCEACGVLVGVPCREEVPGARAFGAHVVRARAAGVLGVQLELPKRAPRGPRKLATVRPVECWARLPWAKPCAVHENPHRSAHAQAMFDKLSQINGRGPTILSCDSCHGLGFKAVRWKAAEEKGALAEVVMPLEARRHAWGEVCRVCGGFRSVPSVIDAGANRCDACQGHGRVLRMIRRPWRRAGVECWLYEPAT